MPFTSPVADIQFVLEHMVGFPAVAETPHFADATPEMVASVLEGAGKICDEVLAPLNRVGDTEQPRLENGVVVTSPGFAEAYNALREGGWLNIAAPSELGGLGLPNALNTAVNEMSSGACLSLNLCILLSQGQIEALEAYASDEIKATYLPPVIAGDWTGTMNLTEPQAGTDVGALRTKAEPNGDGSYALTGQKIYISWGDADFAENIVHLVLARLPDAPAGTKGVSLFLVPKYLPDADGKPGQRNGLAPLSLEHKLGLHGSPTCVMNYAGATGWLIGEPGTGMRSMFKMMNNARLGVAMQGIGVAEAATQAAEAYASERVQGRPMRGTSGAIADHADVRRMLRTMRADVITARAIALDCAVAGDMMTATGDPVWASRAALLTPIAKAFGTDTGIACANAAIQVHGGMGFIEETGVAQYLRDVRVTAIYEGTNGVQAMDLVGRKMMDGGEAMFHLLEEIEANAEAARATLPDLAEPVWQASETLREVTEAMVAQTDMNARFAGAVAYLKLCARVLGGHYHLRAARADPKRIAMATVYTKHLLPETLTLAAQALAGDAGLYDEDFDQTA